MIISPKHFPPIALFSHRKTKVLLDYSLINPTKSELNMLRKAMHILIAESRKNIFTVSTGIRRLIVPNREKLADAYWNNPEKESFAGAYISTGDAFPVLLLYNFIPCRDINPKTGKESECLDYYFANIEGNNMVTAEGVIRLFYHGDENYTLQFGITTIKGELHEKRIEQCRNNMFYLLDVSLFLKYADVEVINIYGNQRKTLPDKSDVVENKSGVRVQYIDSRWVREIIRTEGFKVRGHFRLQPIKDEEGEWTRKLIYINEFEKHGYHRRALKMLENNTDLQ